MSEILQIVNLIGIGIIVKFATDLSVVKNDIKWIKEKIEKKEMK